jgi:hypothetical protein
LPIAYSLLPRAYLPAVRVEGLSAGFFGGLPVFVACQLVSLLAFVAYCPSPVFFACPPVSVLDCQLVSCSCIVRGLRYETFFSLVSLRAC